MHISVEGLTKTYGNFKAVDDVSFAVQGGEIVGLVGPNGAGKTTIIHIILGLILPNGGKVRLFGTSLDEDRERILQRLNFTSPYMAFPTRLTVLQNLTVFAGIYNVRQPETKILELLDRFGIKALKNKPVARLSSGEITRVGLCKAFLNDPELLLLDEPTAYLDLQAAVQVRDPARSPAKLWDDNSLYVAQHARGSAHVRPHRLYQPRECHHKRNSNRGYPQDPEGGAERSCPRRGLHSYSRSSLK